MTSVDPGELAAIDARHALARDQLDALVEMAKSFIPLGRDLSDPRTVTLIGDFILPPAGGVHPTRVELATVVALAAIRLAEEAS